ncbi:MAG TPA: hypothetical protein DDZ76_08620 [Xanthomonadales bacterium]|nr:hypothetical protein [Xanthomonadales bacterium]
MEQHDLLNRVYLSGGSLPPVFLSDRQPRSHPADAESWRFEQHGRPPTRQNLHRPDDRPAACSAWPTVYFRSEAGRSADMQLPTQP